MNITKEVQKYKDAVRLLYGQDVLDQCRIEHRPGVIILGLAIKKEDGTWNMTGTVFPQRVRPANLPAMTYELIRRYRIREQQRLQAEMQAAPKPAPDPAPSPTPDPG